MKQTIINEIKKTNILLEILILTIVGIYTSIFMILGIQIEPTYLIEKIITLILVIGVILAPIYRIIYLK